MTTKTEIPMVDCPSHWGHSHPDYCHCQGTGQVADVDRMQMDIAAMEKQCQGWKEHPHHIDCECNETGRVAMLPGLREDCFCNLGRWYRPEGFSSPGQGQWIEEAHPVCQGRTWTPNVTMSGLLVGLKGAGLAGNIGLSGTDFTGEVFLSDDICGEYGNWYYDHADPEIALLGAAWLALREVSDDN